MPDLLPAAVPWLIAHRAANSLDRLRAAWAAGADFVECDLWSYRGRFEVRHEKTLGRLPLRWDRWKLESSRTRHLDLEALLAAWAGPGALYVDLKGRDRRLPYALLEALQRNPVPIVASGRRPAMLDPLAAEGIPVFPSVGSEADLLRLERLASRRRWDGLAVHRELLTPAMATRLRALAPRILSWPVNTEAAAGELARLGVDGLIIDSLGLLQSLAEKRPACPS